MVSVLIDPKYRIGIDEMDVQHARWIDLIHCFRAAAGDDLTDRRGVDAARLALDDLLDYTRWHFASEEALLNRHDYPDLSKHVVAHRGLVKQLQTLRDELGAHQICSTPLKLNLMVNIWLMEHIMQDDLAYAKHIRSRLSAPPHVQRR